MQYPSASPCLPRLLAAALLACVLCACAAHTPAPEARPDDAPFALGMACLTRGHADSAARHFAAATDAGTPPDAACWLALARWFQGHADDASHALRRHASEAANASALRAIATELDLLAARLRAQRAMAEAAAGLVPVIVPERIVVAPIQFAEGCPPSLRAAAPALRLLVTRALSGAGISVLPWPLVRAYERECGLALPPQEAASLAPRLLGAAVLLIPRITPAPGAPGHVRTTITRLRLESAKTRQRRLTEAIARHTQRITTLRGELHQLLTHKDDCSRTLDAMTRSARIDALITRRGALERDIMAANAAGDLATAARLVPQHEATNARIAKETAALNEFRRSFVGIRVAAYRLDPASAVQRIQRLRRACAALRGRILAAESQRAALRYDLRHGGGQSVESIFTVQAGRPELWPIRAATTCARLLQPTGAQLCALPTAADMPPRAALPSLAQALTAWDNGEYATAHDLARQHGLAALFPAPPAPGFDVLALTSRPEADVRRMLISRLRAALGTTAGRAELHP